MKLRALVVLCLLTGPSAGCFPTAPAAKGSDASLNPETGPGQVDAAPGVEDGTAGTDSAATTDAVTSPDAAGPDAAEPDADAAADVAPADDVTPGTDTSEPTEIPLDQLASAYSSVYCNRLVTCPNAFDGAGLLSAFARADPGACEAWAARRFASDILRNVEAGLVSYDPSAAATCIANLASSCVLGTEEDPTCARVFTGRLEQGKLCENDDACQPGLYCAFGENWQCGGVCTPSPKLGEPCRDAEARCSQVEGPAFCNFNGDRCDPRPEPITAAPGGRCGGDASPENPGAQVVCPDRHLCTRLPNASDETCEPLLEPGAPCDRGGACPIGTLCRQAGTGASCEAYIVANTVGAACSESPQSAGRLTFCNLFLSLGCGATSVCEQRNGLEGETCSGQHPCKEGLYCSGRGFCAQPRRDGEACNLDAGCLSGACVSGVCGTPTCSSR